MLREEHILAAFEESEGVTKQNAFSQAAVYKLNDETTVTVS